MHVQITTHRTAESDGYKWGISMDTAPRYFYYPDGDYEAAIDKLEEMGFIEGHITVPGRDFYKA